MNTETTPAAIRPSWRRAAELAIPALAVVVAGATPLVLWNRLPDPMASHWDISGTPDASLPRVAEFLLITALTAAILLGALAVSRLRLTRGAARLHIGLLAATSAFLASLRVVTLLANLDAPTWREAGSVGWSVLLCLAIALAAGALGVLLAGGRPELERTSASVEAAPVEPGQALVWSGHAGGKAVALAPLILMLLAAVLGWPMPQPGGIAVLIVLPLAALLVATLGQARVTIGPRGVLVVFGWLGWPRIRVPVQEISAVEVENVEPAAYGGWGLRRVPGALAVVTRRGPALRIERTDKPALVITADGAAEAASVLAAQRKPC